MWRWIYLFYYILIQKKIFFIGKFFGQRFVQGKDVSLILIYDNKGAIAGVQMGVSWF